MLTSAQNQKAAHSSPKSYNEVVTMLNLLPPISYGQKTVERTKKLLSLCGHPEKNMKIILIGGSNGKSITAHFASQLLQEEDCTPGTVFSDHFLSYNERLMVGSQQITNKQFAQYASTVLALIKKDKIAATAFEVMLAVALNYFAQEQVATAIIEIGMGGKYDATAALTPDILAITRVSEITNDQLPRDLDELSYEILSVAKPHTWVVSSEQKKLRLKKMKAFAEQNTYRWAMPIRKVASLPYIFEQLYGHMASLAERIGQLYVEELKGAPSPFLRGTVLATQKGHRGRPTLEAKRHAALFPVKTLKNFWRNNFTLPTGRLEILDKEKPSILLDNARNLDALNNLFLAVRLLHYRRPLKNVAFILGVHAQIDIQEFFKNIRYLCKRITTKLFFVPLSPHTPCHDTTALVHAAQAINLQAYAHQSLQEAFDAAKKQIDERQGLLVVSGAPELISDYWKHIRQIKNFKFSRYT
jgi:dihydrofolate synthase/folylpolyglutamate synthase